MPALAVFERESGHAVRVEFAAAPALAGRFQAPPGYDAVIAPPAVLDALARAGAVEGARVPVGKVGIGVAVRSGVTAPDIGSVEALKQSLLAADSVAFNRASTGLYVETLIVRLGVADAVNAKATRPPDGAAVMKHLLGSSRPGEFGLGAITEIVLFKDQGLKLVGPLPAAVQNYTSYLASVAAPPGTDPARAALPRRCSASLTARRRAGSSPTSASRPPLPSANCRRGIAPNDCGGRHDQDLGLPAPSHAARRHNRVRLRRRPVDACRASGGVARRLTAGLGEPSTPCLSPDGKWLAFVSRDEQHPEVYLMPAEGGPARRMTWLGPDVHGARLHARRPASSSSPRTASRSSATTARSRSIPRAACRELVAARPGQPPRVRSRQGDGDRPQHRRSRALEALSRRHRRASVDRRRPAAASSAA